MINPISSVVCYTPNYGFRSNNINQASPNFQNKAVPKSVPLEAQKIDWLKIDKILMPKNPLPDIKNLPGAKLQSFAPGTKETMRNKTIENEKNHLSNPVTKRTEFNTKQLIAAGIPSRDVKKYLKIDGHVTDEGKRILREKGKSYQ